MLALETAESGLWPSTKPDVLQLYSWTTPNGYKISVMLEEIGLAYEAHAVSLPEQQQLTPEFLAINPNNKIPAIVDPKGPDGKSITLFEIGRAHV